MDRGQFITLEGGEGAGKTTQATRLAEALKAANIETLLTREPGGTFGAEAIRELVLSGSQDRWDGMTELLLMYAARIDHVERLIKPALDRGVWVISDRFSDSTMAYQGYARGLGAARVKELHDVIMDGFEPDLTLLFDMDPVLAMGRVERRGEKLSRFDAEEIDFHKTLRAAFLQIASDNKPRIFTLDAGQSKDAVTARMLFGLVKAYPQLSGRLGLGQR